MEVGFPASAAFNKRKAEAAEARDRFTEAVKTIVGERLRPVYVLLETATRTSRRPREAVEDELIELDADRVRRGGIRARAGAGREPKPRRRDQMTRLPQGAGGLDMNAMMKQVQQMQAEMTEAQEKLKDEVVEASAGGGMVKVKMSGDLRLLELTIDPQAIDPEDAELLQDMVLAAVNEAIRSAQELAASKMGGIAGLGGPAGGLGIPGCVGGDPPGAPSPGTARRAAR